MPRTRKGESTPRQFAYARRLFGGKGKDRKQIALDVGYTPTMANHVKEKIESTVGFNSAMMKLAADSNNVALAALHEFKIRGFDTFSNKDLVGALNAIGNAWSRFNPEARKRGDEDNQSKNRLRTVVMQHIENQTLNTGPIQEALPVEEVVDNDF